jgi:hypothetical protein
VTDKTIAGEVGLNHVFRAKGSSPQGREEEKEEF